MMAREEYLPESRACVARQSAIGVFGQGGPLHRVALASAGWEAA